MSRTLFIILVSGIFFVLEWSFFNLSAGWVHPQLILLAVIFFNLYYGVRYSLGAAVLGGLLKDSFGIHVFGLHTFSLVACAYLTTIIKRYVYHYGSGPHRILLVLIMTFVYLLVFYLLNRIFNEMSFFSAFLFVMIPEILATALITHMTFDQLKRCVLKFCV